MIIDCLTYIGYFYSPYEIKSSIVLCVSDEAWKCKYYCEKVRKLDRRQYEVREVVLDENSRYSLFEDFILEEFDENILFLTTQDIFYLTREVDHMIDKYEALSQELKAYRDSIRQIPSMRSDANDISRAILTIDDHLSSVSTIRLLCNQMYRSSVVFSDNIYEYLDSMKSLSYDRELNDMYTMKMMDDKA